MVLLKTQANISFISVRQLFEGVQKAQLYWKTTCSKN
jgi:hypothetical protein